MSEAPKRKLKLMFNAVEGTGHLMATVGLAQIMAKNGHECVFAINESLVKKVEDFGFRAIPLKQETESNQGDGKFALSENPAADFAKQLQDSGLLSNQTPFEKMMALMKDTRFLDGLTTLMIAFNPQIEKILEEEKPDLWLHDHFMVAPAIYKSKIPWVMIGSASPLMFYDSPLLPPPGSGYSSSNQGSEEWQKFFDAREQTMVEFKKYQTKINDHFDFVDEELMSGRHYWRSPYLNVYQFPLELDYNDVEGFTIPEIFLGVDSFVRQDPGKFDLPAEFLARETGSDKLIYLSMASMGGFDIDLMHRILKVVEKLPYKVIVSKGPRGDEVKLPANCWGENYLPQPEIVELVDLVITHGGNNSFTETFAAGKKMIVMPLFGDQYDNAQRCHDKEYGIRVDPYSFQEQELTDAIEKLMNDSQYDERCAAVRKRIQSSTRREEMAKRIEELVENFNR